jgi:hypothetical protein
MTAARLAQFSVVTVLATATALVGVAAATGTTHGSPVILAAPTHPPGSARHDGVCRVGGSQPAAGGTTTDGRVWVRPKPFGVVTVWLPGLNSRRCNARLVTAGRHTARVVAAAVDAARPVKGGPYACPFDDGTRVDVYLTYPHRGDEFVGVAVTGCRWLTAPARTARWNDSGVARPLRRIAPAPWKRYLG